MERSYKRSKTNIEVDVFDGKHTFKGILVDVSFDGIHVSDIPSIFDVKSKDCVCIASAGGVTVKMGLSPRWYKKDSGTTIGIGFKVNKFPKHWADFVYQLNNNVSAWGKFEKTKYQELGLSEEP